MTTNNIPTVYEWAGGAAAFERLTTVFYRRVLEDPLLRPLFAAMPPEHPQHVAIWLEEVFGGPKTYTEERGGYPHMLGKHRNLGLKEEQRVRWAQLIAASADEAGLPSDPEFRSAFAAYIEWGTRLALANSQPGSNPPLAAPVPRWGWGEAPPHLSSRQAQDPAAASAPAHADAGGASLAAQRHAAPGFAADIRPLFRSKDVQSMNWALNLSAYADVRTHAEAIYGRLSGGTMPCDGGWPPEQIALFRRWMDEGYAP